MTTETAQKITVITEDWTGRNGQHRRYIQNVPELIGLELDFYKTGNVCSARLDGIGLSHAKATELASVKAWIDDDEQLHVQTYGTPREMTLDEIASRISKNL
ncbi:MAG: hypothetical protein SOI13_01695 [Bifidobacterium mongoliense]|jgi:hypothetical protein|uniref:hypothetical protein n=1 Tax=Bifidobacterium mongoliense TaxID=518643 RepID=UPI002F35B79C